jgi:GxxExxY protein
VDRLSGVVIGCAFRVMDGPNAGFAERIYEDALGHELRKAGLDISQRQVISVRHYDGFIVGGYIADLLINDTIVAELKAICAFSKSHVAQCINYLTATGLHLACCSTSAGPAPGFIE